MRLLTAAGLALSIGLVSMACSSGDGEGGESAEPEPGSETSITFGDADESAPADADDSAPADDDDGETDGAGDDDVAAIEAEVERVIQRNWEIWIDCTTDAEACDPTRALAETESTTSQFYLESVGVVELWKQQGITYQPVEGRPADRFVEIQSIDVSPDRLSAEVLVCDRDDRARFERNGDGAYEMVEGTDFVEDLLLRRVVAVEGGVWKIVDNELLDRRAVTEGIDPLC